MSEEAQGLAEEVRQDAERSGQDDRDPEPSAEPEIGPPQTLLEKEGDEMWRELVRRWYREDPFQYPEPGVRQYYCSKFSIAKRLRPLKICEIGVRAGYSAFAFLRACPEAFFLGIDKNLLGIEWQEAHMRQVLDGYRFAFMRLDTLKLDTIPGGPYDLVHVDGDHSHAGFQHDLHLALSCGRYVLVDDYESGAEIRRVCDDWLAKQETNLKSVFIPDGLRGQMLIWPARLSHPNECYD